MEKVQEKLTLLDCLSLFQTQQLPYDFQFEEIANTINCSPEDVPEKLYELTQSYCNLSIDFINKKVHVVSSQPRTFGKQEWVKLKTELEKAKL